VFPNSASILPLVLFANPPANLPFATPEFPSLKLSFTAK